MSRIEELRASLSDMDFQISELMQTRDKIYKELQAEEKDEQESIMQRWNLAEDSTIVLFRSAVKAHHECFVRSWNIREVDYKHRYIDVIEQVYYELDHAYWTKCEEARIRFDQLYQLEREYNIYEVVPGCAAILQSLMCGLEINYKNLKDTESTFAESATRVIACS